MGKLVITHGDGDGVISGAALLRLGLVDDLFITQPFLLDKVQIKEGVDEIYIVDIGVNNKDPEMTLGFVRKHADKIVLWVDHHQGGEALKEILGDKFIYDPESPSCPALLAKAGYNIPTDWVKAANASDRPSDFPATSLSERYNNAFKVALVDLQDGDRSAVEKVQSAFIDELTSGRESDIVTDYGSRYEGLLSATNAAAETISELCPGVGIAKASERVDKTALFQAGYKKFPVVLIQHVSPETGEGVTTIATSRKDLNLVEVFGLGSGAPFRVSLRGGTYFDQLRLVKEKLG